MKRFGEVYINCTDCVLVSSFLADLSFEDDIVNCITLSLIMLCR